MENIISKAFQKIFKNLLSNGCAYNERSNFTQQKLSHDINKFQKNLKRKLRQNFMKNFYEKFKIKTKLFVNNDEVKIKNF